jgi:type IV pilus assembly protein PilA
LSLASGDQLRISEAYVTSGTWPTAKADPTTTDLPGVTQKANSQFLSKVDLQANGVIQYTLQNIKATDVDSKTITFIPTDNGGNISWRCTSSANQKFLPKACAGAST